MAWRIKTWFGGTSLDGFPVWKEVTSWNDLVECETKLDLIDEEWIFRGQASDTWPLDSTLQWYCARYGITGNDVKVIEQQLLIDFWRYYDLYSVGAPPPDDDTLGWLSLMRHYGTPTRLTDFTRSLFIAAFFALEDSREDSVVWAVSKTWLTKATQSAITKMGDPTLLSDWGNHVGDAFDRIFFRKPPSRFVSPASPAKMHERMAIQQSIFVCPGDVAASFLDNLRAMADSKDKVRPIVIKRAAQNDIMLKLLRIGIDRSALFPGLEGFAQSMRNKIRVFRKLSRMDAAGGRLGPNIEWARKRNKN
jgi:hypothetical protein